MSEQQREQVAGAVQVYKQIRPEIAVGLPFWPLGLPRGTIPGWHSESVPPAAATSPSGTEAPLARRAVIQAPVTAGDPAVATLPIPHLRGQPLIARILYPAGAGAGTRWDARAGALTVSLPRTPSACVT